MKTNGTAPPERYDKSAPRRLRVASGMTLADAAKRARITRQALNYLERRMTTPRADTIVKLAQLYGVDVNAFFVVKGGAA